MIRPDIRGLHPAKFYDTLLKRVKRENVTIHGQTKVTKVSRIKNSYVIDAPRGITVADNLIIATSGYTDAFEKWLRRRLIPVTGPITTTKTLPLELMSRPMPNKLLFGGTRKLSHYFRPYPNGTRILMGGSEDENSDDPT